MKRLAIAIMVVACLLSGGTASAATYSQDARISASKINLRCADSGDTVLRVRAVNGTHSERRFNFNGVKGTWAVSDSRWLTGETSTVFRYRIKPGQKLYWTVTYRGEVLAHGAQRALVCTL